MDEELRKAIMDRAAATAQNAQGALGRTSMTSPSASRLPTSDFSSIQPRQQPTLPFAGGGTATMGLGGANVNYPYSRGMMAGSPESFASRLPQAPAAPSNLFSVSPVAESLRPTSGGMLNQQYTNPFASPAQRMVENLSLGLTALPTKPNIGIGGGPMSLRGETAMTAPQTAEQRGLTPTAVREGTVYATPQQLANLNARTTAFEGRTPEQQQALLAQMRERGRAMAGSQETFFAQKAAEREGLRTAEATALARGIRTMDIMRARESTQPSTLAGIRSQAYQYTQRLPFEGLATRAASEFASALPVGGSKPRPISSLGPSGYALYEQQQAARRVAGMTGPYSNTRAQQRQTTREMARSMGMQPAYNRRAQQEQEEYFRSRGLM